MGRAVAVCRAHLTRYVVGVRRLGVRTRRIPPKSGLTGEGRHLPEALRRPPRNEVGMQSKSAGLRGKLMLDEWSRGAEATQRRQRQ
jgi:hypothetical protein